MKKIKQTIVVGKEEYKKRVIEMIDEIENEKILKLLFEFVKAGLKEERAS